ncbi:hypothetical protein [Paraflavitalea speifideaquila]|uniref:hypothetical protein n=1 Tax=Paraflavitalea speifideaquila TaxID=3076558 RepID=UPI0028E3EB32|nr:hypothetical protein [Paraflavitalea speifideiaquila]
MLKLSELQPGDIVMAEFEGQQMEGTVKELNREDKEVCVETSVQEFWFKPEHLYPIPLSEEQLLKLGFERVENGDGSVKYKKILSGYWYPIKAILVTLISGGGRIAGTCGRPSMCMNYRIITIK